MPLTTPTPVSAPPSVSTPAALPEPSPLVIDLLAAKREMQGLYRSIDALVAAKACGTFLMFSSAHQGEGKTTVCSSFAAVLAQYFGKSVLILDGDRNHSLSRRFGSLQQNSIETLSRSPEAVLQASKTVGARGSIAAVPIGSLFGASSTDSPELELLESVKHELTNTFDYVLIDAPSVAEVSWSTRLGRIADGVILVIEAERTRWPVAMNTKEEFEHSGAKVIGVFLNKRKFYIPARIYRFL